MIRTTVLLALAAFLPGVATGRTLVLEVGEGRTFASLQEAYGEALPGDTILVHARPDNGAYERVALQVRKARLTIRAAREAGAPRVPLSGEGFDYTGAGPVPRAIVQFDRGADDCLLEGFELFGARNGSFNGAGVRINQANDVTVRDCAIHHNQMGVMSNGDGTPARGRNQRFERCAVYANGDEGEAGYNHNLYLGGASVTLLGCEVYGSLTGHNVKSRAHFNRIEACYIHDAANREIDLVDGRETALEGSHAVLAGNVIVKHPRCPGNRNVIHFGQDNGGAHDGTLYLAHNTVVTTYRSPVVLLTAPQARAHLVGNLVWDGGISQRSALAVETRNGAGGENVTGSRNWMSFGFGTLAATAIEHDIHHARWGDDPPFADAAARDFRLTKPMEHVVDVGAPLAALALPPTPGDPASETDAATLHVYVHPAGFVERVVHGAPDAGAYEYAPAR